METFIITDFVDRYTAADPDRTIIRYKRKKGGHYEDLTWSALQGMVSSFAAGLIRMGMNRGDRVCVLSFNRLEWIVADQGIMAAGGVNVPIYHTNTAEQCAYIIDDSGAAIVVVEDTEQLHKITAMKRPDTSRPWIILLEGVTDNPEVVTYTALMEAGHMAGAELSQEIEQRKRSIKSDDLATIVYTSGTTGPPKGCRMSYRNISYVLSSIDRLLRIDPRASLCLMILPLSHFYPRISGYYFNIYKNVPLALAESIDALAKNMFEVRPTYFCGVPRIFEKVYARIAGTAEKGSAIQRIVFRWAVQTGRRRSRLINVHKPLPLLLRLAWRMANRLVFNKIREALGGRLEFAVSAGAPLSAEVGEFIHSIGIQVIEFYGLSETIGGTMTTFTQCRYGTVGKAMPGFEVKLAPDGEILIRGNNFLGYHNRADLTEASMQDGWFLTGDVGLWDNDGFLIITDRKKDLIITSGGKNISPQNIENSLQMSPYIEQAAVIGDNRNFLTALIVPAFPDLERWALANGIGTVTRKDLLRRAEVISLFDSEIGKHTMHLGRVEQIRKYVLLDESWSQETDELTPTLKLKRSIINQKYAKQIEGLYAD